MKNCDSTFQGQEGEVEEIEETSDRSPERDTAAIEAVDFFESARRSRERATNFLEDIKPRENVRTGNNRPLLECKKTCQGVFKQFSRALDSIIDRLEGEDTFEIFILDRDIIAHDEHIGLIEKDRATILNTIERGGPLGFLLKITFLKFFARWRRNKLGFEINELRKKIGDLGEQIKDIDENETPEKKELVRIRDKWSMKADNLGKIDMKDLKELFLFFNRDMKGHSDTAEVSRLMSKDDFQDAFQKILDFLAMHSIVTTIKTRES